MLDTSLAVELSGLGGYVGAFDAMLSFVESVTHRLQELLADQQVKTDAKPLVNVGAVLFEERSLGYPVPPRGSLGVDLANVTEGLIPMLNYSTVRMSLLRPLVSFGPTKTDTALAKARGMITGDGRRQVTGLSGAAISAAAAVVVISAGQSLNGAPMFNDRQPEIEAELEEAFWHTANVCRHAVGTGQFATVGAEPQSKAAVVRAELELLGGGSFAVMEDVGAAESLANALAQCTTNTLVKPQEVTLTSSTTIAAAVTAAVTTTTVTAEATAETSTAEPTTVAPAVTTAAVPNVTTTAEPTITLKTDAPVTTASQAATAAPGTTPELTTEPSCLGQCQTESANFCGAISWDNVINCDTDTACLCHSACVFFGPGACCPDYLDGGCD